jgi:hypothetical protein
LPPTTARRERGKKQAGVQLLIVSGYGGVVLTVLYLWR